MIVLIGSAAMDHHFRTREPNDIDYVGSWDELQWWISYYKPVTAYPINAGKSYFMQQKDKSIVEWEIAWEGSRAEKFLQFMATQSDRETFGEVTIPSLDVLYMLKMSHRYLKDSPHFLKTMEDIRLMRAHGAQLRPEHEEFYQQRMKDTYTYNLPKLNVSKEAFFVDDIYTYDHDSIHEAVKILTCPAYQYFKPADSAVMVSKDMWDRVGTHVQRMAVYEEACVLALERSLIPFPGKKTVKEAFDMALMKVCTSITSGWFREFAWENYDAIQVYYAAYHGDDLYHVFLDQLERGIVKPHNKEKE